MRFVKILSSLLVFVMLASMLSSCNDKGTKNDTSSSDTTAFGTSNIAVNFDILYSNLPQYIIVRPDVTSTTVQDAAINLMDEINEKLDTEIGIKTDFYKENMLAYQIGEYEILVGKTNRPETAEFMTDCMRDEYGYKIVGNKIVICGGNDEAVDKAVSKFIADIVYNYNKNDTVFMAKDLSYKCDKVYPVSNLVLNGIAINEYTIIYKSYNRLFEKDAALKLQDDISIQTGYILDVVSDNIEYIEGTHAILIGDVKYVTDEMKNTMTTVMGDSSDILNYYIGTNDNFIWLMGAATFSALSGVDVLSEKISQCADDNVSTLTLEESYLCRFETSDISVMSFNVLTTKPDTARINRVVSTIQSSAPDLLGIQEGSPYWMSVLKTELSSIYNTVGEGRDGGDSGEYSAIFYAKDKFNCLESGTKWLSDTPDVVSKYDESSLNRIFTYAILEKKDDNTKFLYINTHLEHTSEDARVKQIQVILNFIAEHQNLPIILTGDFNTQSTSDVYKNIIAKGFLDCGINATQRTNVGPTFPSSSKIIDFCFITASTVVANTYKVINDKVDGEYPSDHFPIYCEVSILK